MTMQNPSLSRRSMLQASFAAAGALGLTLTMPKEVWAQLASGKLAMGINLAGISDWDPGFPFLNLMWGARTWITKNAEAGGPWNTDLVSKMEMDADGYPLEVPFVIEGSAPQKVATLLPNREKKGEYVILYDGEGEFAAGGRTKVVSQAPGRVLLTMEHNGVAEGDGALEEVSIVKSVRGNHVRNVRLVPIENESTDLSVNPFRQELLDFCKPFHCIRFMDWQGTNNSNGRYWKDRKTPSFYTQRGDGGDVAGIYGAKYPEWKFKFASGVAIDLCIQLCNLAKTDGWFCVPHLADDEYITEMAKLIKAKLDPSLKCHIEFSNEVWNWQFQQAQCMLRSKIAGEMLAERGIKAWKDDSIVEFNEFGIAIKGEGDNFPERLAMLQIRAFKLFEAVFDGADRSRLVRTAASQQGWFDISVRSLGLIMKNGGCEDFSVAGYFGPNSDTYKSWALAGAALTAEQVLVDMKGIVQTDSKPQIAQAGGLCKQHKVRYAVYEGGQHIQPEGQAELPYNPALAEAQKHPQMYDRYRENFELHIAQDCALYMIFSSVGRQGTRWGSWGHLEYYGQNPKEMPKMQAVLDFNTPKAS